jgi:carboxypeptidase Taq
MHNKSQNANFNTYAQTLATITDVYGALALMQWDQETYMPAGSAEPRSRQIATLSEMAHNLATDEKFYTLVTNLKNDATLNAWEQKNVAITFKQLERKRKIPSAFVAQFSKTISQAFEAWTKAKTTNDIKLFEPHLQKIIDCKKQEVDYVGYDAHIYNACIDEYDDGMTVAQLDAIFEPILPQLKTLIQTASAKNIDDEFLHNHYDKDKQWQYGLDLIKSIGFNFETGRQDLSSHPFTTNFASTDVRLTTRIDVNNFANMAWSCLHEAGHGLYEQGLNYANYGLPAGEYSSLSIHESQSRFWENCIGRSDAFWQGQYEDLVNVFPASLYVIPQAKFVAAINKVQPSLIRTEADELTYHFHVYIRYTIEKEMMAGQLKATEVKERWNSLYKQYLGVTPPTDTIGCLQDVHWSHGSIGYFPTYSLGSMAAAQLWNALQQKHPNIKQEIATKNYTNIHTWLAENIYAHGKLLNTNEIMQFATGEVLNSKYFINHAIEKFS